MQLIVGCGPNWPKRKDDIFLDVRPFAGVDVVHDLDDCPWPFKTDSFNEVSAIHVVEHLQNLIAFMDECHRILKPGGSLYIETPEAGADLDLQFADPTHVRCYRKHTFVNYFTRAEAPKFGYTYKHWSIWHLESKNGNLIFHGQPIK
jgi:predicted SAM-dependent methyltransferase